jgi:hypothetical protein
MKEIKLTLTLKFADSVNLTDREIDLLLGNLDDMVHYRLQTVGITPDTADTYIESHLFEIQEPIDHNPKSVREN